MIAFNRFLRKPSTNTQPPDLVLVPCVPYRGRLSVTACLARYRSPLPPAGVHDHYADCRCCAAGAERLAAATGKPAPKRRRRGVGGQRRRQQALAQATERTTATIGEDLRLVLEALLSLGGRGSAAAVAHACGKQAHCAGTWAARRLGALRTACLVEYRASTSHSAGEWVAL